MTEILRALDWMQASPSIVAAVLIGYYFAMRVSEIRRLRIIDLQLDGTPTVFVWKSKRGYSRAIEGVHIPEYVRNWLSDYKELRTQQSENNLTECLIVNSDGGDCTGVYLEMWLKKAMNSAGISIKILEKRGLFHLIRHGGVNRWYALGLPLHRISHLAGHHSILVTTTTYLHGFHFFQRKQLLAHHKVDHPKD